MTDQIQSFLKIAKSPSFENIINLDLNNSGIDCNKCIEFFPKLINLKCLILSNNNLNQIPEFDKLLTLEELYLRNVLINNKLLDSENIKSFISKIKGLTNLKHIVTIGSKFDTNLVNDYLIYYINSLETLNFKKISIEKREESNNRIKAIKEKQQQQQQQQNNNLKKSSTKIVSPTSSPISKVTPTKLSNSKIQNSPTTSKRLENVVSSINISKSPVINSPLRQTTSASPIKPKVNFKLPPQIENVVPLSPDIRSNSNSPLKTKSNNQDDNNIKVSNNNNNNNTPTATTTTTTTTNGNQQIEIKNSNNIDGGNSKSNLILAISLLIESIDQKDDIEYIENMLNQRKNFIK